MSAPVKKCEVTPLEALQRLIGAASVIDANECKDEVVYNVLQSELAVAKEVAKSLAAAPVVPVAAQPVVQQQPMIGRLLDDLSALPVLWGLNEPSALLRHGQVFDMLVKVGKEYAAPSLEAQPAGEAIPVDKLCALLPGPYYMDPPDGGSVTVLEQVERMAQDAARYHWLCKVAFDSSMDQEQINKEVDAAMAQGEKA